MRPSIDQTPHAQRASMSPAAWCVHRILTSPSARKRGVSAAQQHLLRSCAKLLREDGRRHLAELGHSEALDRHCRVQGRISADGGGAAGDDDLERRKEIARLAIERYVAPEDRAA